MAIFLSPPKLNPIPTTTSLQDSLNDIRVMITSVIKSFSKFFATPPSNSRKNNFPLPRNILGEYTWELAKRFWTRRSVIRYFQISAHLWSFDQPTFVGNEKKIREAVQRWWFTPRLVIWMNTINVKLRGEENVGNDIECYRFNERIIRAVSFVWFSWWTRRVTLLILVRAETIQLTKQVIVLLTCTA